MKPKVYNRVTWGVPVSVDPRLESVADDIFPDSAIFSNESINKAWGADWEDEDILDAEWFVLNLTNRNHRADYGSGEREFIPTELAFFRDAKPTIGEMVFVTRRFPFALNMLHLPNFGDTTHSFTDSLRGARKIFPKHEALAWALLHYGIVGDEAKSTFAQTIGALYGGKDVSFDDVAALPEYRRRD